MLVLCWIEGIIDSCFLSTSIAIFSHWICCSRLILVHYTMVFPFVFNKNYFHYRKVTICCNAFVCYSTQNSHFHKKITLASYFHRPPNYCSNKIHLMFNLAMLIQWWQPFHHLKTGRSLEHLSWVGIAQVFRHDWRSLHHMQSIFIVMPTFWTWF